MKRNFAYPVFFTINFRLYWEANLTVFWMSAIVVAFTTPQGTLPWKQVSADELTLPKGSHCSIVVELVRDSQLMNWSALGTLARKAPLFQLFLTVEHAAELKLGSPTKQTSAIGRGLIKGWVRPDSKVDKTSWLGKQDWPGRHLHWSAASICVTVRDMAAAKRKSRNIAAGSSRWAWSWIRFHCPFIRIVLKRPSRVQQQYRRSVTCEWSRHVNHLTSDIMWLCVIYLGDEFFGPFSSSSKPLQAVHLPTADLTSQQSQSWHALAPSSCYPRHLLVHFPVVSIAQVIKKVAETRLVKPD